jgi:hypothetical protein
MTEFITPTKALLTQLEPEAGDVLKPVPRRRRETEFWPSWDYITSPAASVNAVVAALTLSAVDVPAERFAQVIATHCPRVNALLAEHCVSIDEVMTGRAMPEVTNLIAAVVNTELGGYAVMTVTDFTAMVAETIAQLGAVPTFTDEHPRI